MMTEAVASPHDQDAAGADDSPAKALISAVRTEVEHELVRRASIDELTGLATRAVMQQHVESLLGSKRKGERFALAFIDLDNFKHVNDYYSHAIGDGLIVKVAQRIVRETRDTDLVARISGDEFVLVIDPVYEREDLHGHINRILDQMKKPFYIEGYEVLTSASIGVSVFPEHGHSYEVLRRHADSAMYSAKRESKGSAVFFTLGMSQTITARMEMEQRLRLAIHDRRFCCAFQPKVDIKTEEIVGFETLIRWRAEDGTIRAPGDFVGLATELGLINPITQFVAAEAIESTDLLDGLYGGGKTISINIAAKQAGDVEFMNSLVATFCESGRPERFMLEVTEDAIVAKSPFQTHVLPLLKKHGIRVSIDDFGTGYSSLSALSDLTADEIKIDRSFITEIHLRPRSQHVLKTIETLGHALGMSMVAEGVETIEELTYLREHSTIPCVQGYYFARPFFLDDAESQRSGSSMGRNAQPARERPDTRTHVSRSATRSSRRSDG
jgi:cyclic di-GMP phosphodiesterase Gmr